MDKRLQRSQVAFEVADYIRYDYRGDVHVDRIAEFVDELAEKFLNEDEEDK